MDTNTLVVTKEMREQGWDLLDKAKKQGQVVLGLFWGQFDEGDWRLFLVIPAEQSALPTYTWLRVALPSDLEAEQSETFLLSPTAIAVVSPNYGIVKSAHEWARSRYETLDGSVADDPRLVRRVSLEASSFYIYCLAPEK